MREDGIEFHVHGHVRPPYDQMLRTLAAPNVYLHGAYEPGSCHQCLLDADVGLFLSIWPETHLLTLSEAWNAGVVPIVTDIGAPGERVAHRINGLKVPVNDPAGVVDALRELIADRRELERLRGAIHRGLYRTTSEHVRRLTERYEELLDAYRVRLRGEEFFGEKPAQRAASAGNVFRMANAWLMRESGTALLSRPYGSVYPCYGSAGYHGSDTSGKALWRKVIPYLRSHGVKATARRTGEKIVERLVLLQHKNAVPSLPARNASDH
jgi:hypothetical protein